MKKEHQHPFVQLLLQLMLGEEVALSKLTLMEIINKICDGVQARAELGLYSSLIIMLQLLVGKMLVALVGVNFVGFSSQSGYMINPQLKEWLSIFR